LFVLSFLITEFVREIEKESITTDRAGDWVPQSTFIRRHASQKGKEDVERLKRMKDFPESAAVA
jgi:hypothetical protein